MFDLIPGLFIRIEFRGMCWEKEHPNLSAMRPYKLTYHCRTMKRDFIRNNNQGAGATTQDLLKKLYIPFSINILLFQSVNQFPLRRDDRQDVITAPLIGYLDLGRNAYLSPGTARPRPDPYPRLIFKADISPHLLGKSLYSREFVIQKVRHLVRILLPRSITRGLTAQTHLGQMQSDS